MVEKIIQTIKKMISSNKCRQQLVKRNISKQNISNNRKHKTYQTQPQKSHHSKHTSAENQTHKQATSSHTQTRKT